MDLMTPLMREKLENGRGRSRASFSGKELAGLRDTLRWEKKKGRELISDLVIVIPKARGLREKGDLRLSLSAAEGKENAGRLPDVSQGRGKHSRCENLPTGGIERKKPTGD